MKTCDVAIVGAGPVGVAAANLCGVHGLSTVILDRETEVYDLPRAATVHHDAQRILHNAGVLDAILPSTCEIFGAEFVDAAGTRILGIEVPPGLVLDSGFPPLLNISQPDVERRMRACLDRFDDVELWLGSEVVDLVDVEGGVELGVRDRADGRADGRERTMRADWVIGCDGARSMVRKARGIAWSSLGYDRDWLVVDLELTRPLELTPFCQQICDPDRPVTVIPMPGRLRRWEFQLKAGETWAEMEEPARVWELLRPWLSPRDAQILRGVVYRFHATIADTFRSGRVFLAGDAAHQTPPFAGQGLCTGLRDVDNLIWKLAMVCRDVAGDALLDTYTAERYPYAVAMVEHSTNTGKLIDAYAEMARGGPAPTPEMQEYAYGGARTLPDLSAGLLALDGGEWVGLPMPWTVVRSESANGPLDDVVGRRWAVVAAADPRPDLDGAALSLLRRIGAEVVSVPEPAGAAVGLLLAHETIVVRPDRAIYGVAAARDLGALLQRLQGDLG